MSSNRVLIIAREFSTTMDRIKKWFDPFQIEQPTNFGSINETDFEPSLVYFMETPGSIHNRVLYHVVACPLDKVEKVGHDYFDEDEFDSYLIKDYEKMLGLFILETQQQDKVILKGWCADDLHSEIWDFILNEIIGEFSPEDQDISMIDEKVTSSEHSDVLVNTEPEKSKRGMSEWRLRRAHLFQSIKDEELRLTKEIVASRATDTAIRRIENKLCLDHYWKNNKAISNETLRIFINEWSHGKEAFTKEDVDNDYNEMGWDWVDSRDKNLPQSPQ